MLATRYQFRGPYNASRVVFALYELASRCSKHPLLITSSSLISFPIHLTLLPCICSPLASLIELIVSLIVSQSRHRSCSLAAGALFPSQHPSSPHFHFSYSSLFSCSFILELSGRLLYLHQLRCQFSPSSTTGSGEISSSLFCLSTP